MRYVTLLLLVAATVVSPDASAFQKPGFPRLAANWLANANYQDPTIQKQLARGSIAIIGVWDGWDTAKGTTLESVVHNVKVMNPNTLVFNYIINEAITANNTTETELYNKVTAMKWWLYSSGTSGTPLASSWAGDIEVNNTLWTPPDANGDRWVDWYAKWSYNKFAVPSPSLDGFFLDNVFWKPRVNGDWNRDGSMDSADDPTVGTWQRQGLAHHFDVMNQLMPGKYQIGNISDWGHPSAVLTEYIGKLNGGLIEGIIGYSYSVESWGTWQDMMNWYRKAMSALAEPKLAIFHQVGSVTDYRAFRYGFASCLMDDGYYAFNSNSSYGDAPYFDEYKVDLGGSMQAAQTAAWQSGVYRRDFEKGIVLVNPKGNGTRTVTLETDYFRILGTQDPLVNNGQSTRSVTLQDRDGIVLLRSKPAATPMPPNPVSVN